MNRPLFPVPLKPAADLQALLAATRRHSRAALGELLEVRRPALLVLAKKQLAVNLQAKGDASDLVQDAMTEACRDFSQFVGQSDAAFAAWLECILMHNAINFANHYRRTGKRQSSRELSQDDSKHAGLAEQHCNEESTPSGMAQQKEAAAAMARAFEQLSLGYRQVIILHHRENRPFDEVARLMGRTEVAVRKLWGRGVIQWRKETELIYGLA